MYAIRINGNHPKIKWLEFETYQEHYGGTSTDTVLIPIYKEVGRWTTDNGVTRITSIIAVAPNDDGGGEPVIIKIEYEDNYGGSGYSSSNLYIKKLEIKKEYFGYQYVGD